MGSQLESVVRGGARGDAFAAAVAARDIDDRAAGLEDDRPLHGTALAARPAGYPLPREARGLHDRHRSAQLRRIGPEGQLTVVLNLTTEPASVPGAGPGRVLIGTDRDRDREAVEARIDLRPNEAVVVERA